MDTIKKDRNLIIKLISSISLPIGILILMTMMVIPLPVFLLDVFFTSNILISLIVLMVALQTFKPLDFSSFPTVLLFATVLRLGLNVASTRIVLSQGHTGTDAAGNVSSCTATNTSYTVTSSSTDVNDPSDISLSSPSSSPTSNQTPTNCRLCEDKMPNLGATQPPYHHLVP